MQEAEIRKRLNAVIDLWAPGSEREKIARAVVNLLTPEVKKLLKEETDRLKPKPVTD